MLPNDFIHGGDYNPEQWLDRPDILSKDIRLLKKAHCNEVTLGVFSWSVLEPLEGEYHLEWLKKIIDRLYENGIYVILATPSGARPKWLADRYPEVLRVEENGQRNMFGGRHNHCYTSPEYRRKIGDLDTRLAREFGGHPGVIMWHISNELRGYCYCENCQQAFRGWLEKRYGTIEKLNHEWWSTFWSSRFNSFEEVEAPSSIGIDSIPALTVDWKRFCTEQARDFMEHEIRTLKEAGAVQPMTTNYMRFLEDYDYTAFSRNLDVISWDSYPLWHVGNVYETSIEHGMMHDLCRSIKNQPFLLMESSPSSTNWQEVGKLRRPGMQKLASLHAVAHGSDSVQYFQIRQGRGGYEMYHGALIDHYGSEDTRVFREVTDTGQSLKTIGEVCHTKTVSEAAVLYDWENRWAVEGTPGLRNCGTHYGRSVIKAYRELRMKGYNVDVIDETRPLDGYKLLAAPICYMLRPGFAEKLRSFAKTGGTLFLTYWSGYVNESGLAYQGGFPSGLMEAAGLRSMEVDGLTDGEKKEVIAADGNAFSCKGTTVCDLVQVSTACPLLIYNEDFYKGLPAATQNRYGKGNVFYMACGLDDKGYEKLMDCVISCADLAVPVVERIPLGVDVSVRESEDYRYIFVQNFNGEEVALEFPEGEFLLGDQGSGLQPYETVVLKQKKAVRSNEK